MGARPGMVLNFRKVMLPVSDQVLVIVSEEDPVARDVATEWGGLPSIGVHVDGAPVRRLSDRVLVLRRPGFHVRDEGMDARLPSALREGRPTLVFPSIHRSEQNVASLTVHPLGNPGPSAELGGRPRTLVPTDPRRMVSALRLLAESAGPLGLRATYESTHHGPVLELPAFFVEIGYAQLPHPPAEAVRLLRAVIPEISANDGDRVAMAVGGGHYAPHFTDLALSRHWAFGHILSRHALEELDRSTAQRAYDLTPGSEGIVYARAQDAHQPALEGIAPRCRDQDAPARGLGRSGAPTVGGRSASGT